MRRVLPIILAATFVVPIVAQTAGGQSASFGSTPLGQVIILFLILSVALEMALTALFNWRFFLARFEGKGLKTPITVVLGLVIFLIYQVDLMAEVLTALGTQTGNSFPGQFLSALAVTGGSNGVQRIFTLLKIRDPEARRAKAEEAQKALATQARKSRSRAKGRGA